MTPKKIFALTLLATTFTLHAAVIRINQKTTLQKQISITQTLASFLKQRGIEDSSAHKIASNFIGNDEKLFHIMTQNYIHRVGIDTKEFYSELSTLALQRKKADFSDYSFLIKLTQKLQGHALEKEIFTNLHNIATNNDLLRKVFV
jgi:hypothetical protein